jgi:hypothetical protein
MCRSSNSIYTRRSGCPHQTPSTEQPKSAIACCRIRVPSRQLCEDHLEPHRITVCVHFAQGASTAYPTLVYRLKLQFVPNANTESLGCHDLGNRLYNSPDSTQVYAIPSEYDTTTAALVCGRC